MSGSANNVSIDTTSTGTATPSSNDAALPLPLSLSAEAIANGAADDVIRAWSRRTKELRFQRLPHTIVLVRHGQSEGNVDRQVRQTQAELVLIIAACSAM